MLKIFTAIALAGSFSIAWAQSIASCKDPEGYGYHHYAGLVPKASSGFVKDKITGGAVTLQRTGNGKYDILFVDTYKQAISAVADGGTVSLLRKGKNDATFVHYFPGKVIELYTFWVDSEGESKYDLVQSKGGDSMKIHKIAIYVGNCTAIDFGLMD